MILQALQLVYCFLPGYIANSAPSSVAKLFPHWETPVDLGLKFRGKRLLGENKTWRGVIGGTLLGGLVFLLQKYVLTASVKTPFIPYESFPWWYGFLLAFGAIFVGDTGKSLLKRRFQIKPGRPFVPWDQIDYTLGAFLLTFWLFWPGWAWFVFLLVFNGLFSAGSHWLGWHLGLLKDKF